MNPKKKETEEKKLRKFAKNTNFYFFAYNFFSMNQNTFDNI